MRGLPHGCSENKAATNENQVPQRLPHPGGEAANKSEVCKRHGANIRVEERNRGVQAGKRTSRCEHFGLASQLKNTARGKVAAGDPQRRAAEAQDGLRQKRGAASICYKRSRTVFRAGSRAEVSACLSNFRRA